MERDSWLLLVLGMAASIEGEVDAARECLVGGEPGARRGCCYGLKLGWRKVGAASPGPWEVCVTVQEGG